MATIQLAPYRGVVTVMTTELNALGATTGKALSAALDNSTDLDLFANLELSVDFVTAPIAGTAIELYLLPSIDGGTTYPDGSASVEPQGSLFVGSFNVRATTSAQILMVRGIALSPGFHKLLVRNTTDQAFPATGSVLRHNVFQLASV